MLDSLLHTKLHIPSPRPNLVPRLRLIERLNQGLQQGHKLTLVSAPAGFGKTTLIADFGLRIADFSSQTTKQNWQTCWLALDEGDGDPIRFFTYFISALQTVEPGIGEGALAALQSLQPPPPKSVLTILLNDMTTVANGIILVLDDYHVVTNQTIDEALSFLLDHLPPTLHLVITTREDPALPLSRLRARGRLTELRAADLRFTPDEAAQFLNQVMGLELMAEEVAALEKRTEGWITGLQMAALSMQGRSDTAAFIDAFTGSHHFVLDYLLEEVLSRQPQDVQDFLLQTAVLDNLNGPLCDAVCFFETPESSPGTAVCFSETRMDGQQMLEYLQQANLFIIPLDDERRWYRYHHLFADLLRQRAQRQFPDRLAELHGRASAWYEENGLEVEAFHHAAAAGDVARAARLVEGGGMPLHYRGAVVPVINWLASLPKPELDANPALWVTYATALTMTGRAISEVEAVLQAAETALRDTDMDDKNRDLLGQIASIRAMSAVPTREAEVMMAQASQALELLSPDNLAARTGATWVLGLAYQYQGNRIAAVQAYREAAAAGAASGNFMFTIAAKTSLGQIQEAENKLKAAAQNYREVIKLAGDPPLPAAAEAYLGLARIHYEWNDLQNAQAYAEQAMHLGRQMETVDTPAACMALLARLKLVAGNTAGADELLTEAEQFMVQQSFVHSISEIPATCVRLLLAQGEIASAAELAQREELPLSQARVLLTQGDAPAALQLLEAWFQEMERAHRPDEQLKGLVMQALALHATGAKEEAVQRLAEALALAESGGFVRTFVDEGRPMAQLLTATALRGTLPVYTNKLLDEFPIPQSEFTVAHSPTSDIRNPKSEIADPLSPRELEVLQLIAEGLSNREIGERLYLALDTVKGHNRHIYSKLGVQRRTEAVARARELGLL
ncbi:MAG: LuxR C-terminal-related transcriptional regulator [Candidatus Promineifilaceae bacterium]|jgi:LuxR family maltose regulon positive regulatory protein